MSSPIHKYLFSPPPSPPIRPIDIERPSLAPLSLILPPDLLSPRLDAGAELKSRSPRTDRFTLDTTFPTYPTRLELPPVKQELVNVPTNANIPMPSTLPRPLLRLIFFASLVISSIMMLIFVPTARLPSLRTATISRRLALAPDGRAYLDVANSVASWSEAIDRDYVPPQVRAPHMMRRAVAAETVPPHPRTSRPAVVSRPLPTSHELLAVQSYLLESKYNVLPDVDPESPIDANLVLGVGHQTLGSPGSTKEIEWFSELEKEYSDDVIIWHGGDNSPILPHKLIETLTVDTKKPTLMSCHHRHDTHILSGIFSRLGMKLNEGAVVILGNKPYSAKEIESMTKEKVDELLNSIGWIRKGKTSEWKPKLAVWKKRELSEVEHAMKKAKRDRQR